MTGIYVNTSCKVIGLKDPETAYNALRGRDTYLLESSEGGEKTARYSFIGFNPIAKLVYSGDVAVLETEDPVLKHVKITGNDPLGVLRNVLKQFKPVNPSKTRFFGGFVGYVSYDLMSHYVKTLKKAGKRLKTPLYELVLAKENIIYDHVEKKTYLITHKFTDKKSVVNTKPQKRDLEDQYNDLLSRINSEENICQPNLSTFPGRSREQVVSSNVSKKGFIEAVEKAKEYIKAGDIFQVVLSQRLETSFKGDVFEVYKTLKKINPSPYMYCLDLSDRKIVGSSPEMLVRVEGRDVVTYPIAGTRPRGKKAKEDKFLENEMVSDVKERAEHVMLVDLGRNDIGRVACFGSVKVKKFMGVEKYSHVQHMVSEVSGVLKPGLDNIDAFKSVFPAGTVSGAPKVRALEIIQELEKTPRGIYAGAIGYFSFDQNMDMAISIRTIIFEKDRAHIQAGAGIVADSKPEAEFQETLNKAKALLKALKEVNEG